MASTPVMRLARAHLYALLFLVSVALVVLWRLCVLGHVPYDLARQEAFRPWRAEAPVARALPPTVRALRDASPSDPMARYREYWASYVAGDQVVTVWPDHVMVREQVRAGHVPWWQPRGLGGVALLTTTSASPLSPLTWPSYVLPLVRGRAFTLLLHLVIAGFGMYLLLEQRQRSFAASLVGAAVFMLNPLFVAWLYFGDTVPVFGLVPWALVVIDRLAAGARPSRAAACLGALTALEFLGGNPQQALLALAVQGGWVWAATPEPGAGGAPRKGAVWGWFGLATCLGLLAAMVQVLPFVEMLGATARPEDRYRDTNFLPLTSLWTFLFPRLFGHPAQGDWVGGYLFTRPFFSLLGPGPGVAVSALAFAGVVDGRSRRAGAVLAAVLGGMTLLASDALHQAFATAVPFFDGLDALRALGVAYLALAWLCADGLDALAGARAERALRGAALAVLAGALALEIYARAGGGLFALHLRALAHPLVAFAPRVLAPIALAAALAGLARLARRDEVTRQRAALVALGLTAFELVALAGDTLPSAPADRVARETPVVRALRERFRRFAPIRMTGVAEPDTFPPYDGDHLPPNTAAMLGFDDLRVCSRLPPSPMVELLQAVARVDFPTLAPTGTLDLPLFDLLDLGYVLSDHPLAPAHFREVAPGLWANRRPRARAFFTRCTHVEPDARRRVAWITSPAFVPHAAAVVAEDVPGVARCEGDAGIVPGRVRYPAPDRVEVDVQATGNGVLVLADAWFPDWEATVDGATQDVLRVDHALRGVALGEGWHRVVMRYRPASARSGFWLTALGALALLALAWGRRPKLSDDALIALLSAGALVAFAGRVPLPNDNDALYADVIRSMREGGSLVRLAIHGVPFLDKPPLFFMLGAAVTAVLGEGDFTLRVPAIACGVACAVMSARVARRASGSDRAAWVAAALVVTAPLFFEYSRRVYMEVPVALAVIWSFDLATRERWAAAGALAGAGFMLKTIPGGLGLAGAIVAIVVTQRRVPWRGALVASGVFALVVVPWHIAAFAAQPGPMMDFTFKLHVRDQVLSAQPWSTGGPLFYPAALARHDPLMGLAVLATLVGGALAFEKGRKELASIAVALALQLALYTAISTKKDLYLLTAFPLAAAGAAAWLAPWLAGDGRRALLLAGLAAAQFVSLAGDQVMPDATRLPEGWIVPLVRRFDALAPRDATLVARDVYFAAPQFYGRRKTLYAVPDEGVVGLVSRIPYIRYGRLVRVWRDDMIDHGGWAIMKSADGAALLARRPDVRVVARNFAYWLVQGPP